ncbi:TlpA disulfide reductase family protein [Ancylomarina euxina]|nr:TlpA disulfide reductase family protein [Ancylomarina euxinus]
MNLFKVFAIMAIAALLSCSKATDTCLIKGQLSGGDGELVIYPYQEVHSKKEADSLSYKAKISNGKFEIELDGELVCRLMNIKIGNELKRYDVFTEPGIIHLGEKDGKLIAKGSSLNDEYYRLLNELNYEAYDKIKYKKVLSAEEQKLKDEYNRNLWELIGTNSASIPLSYLFYQKYWGADASSLNKIINTFSKDIHQSYYLKKVINRRDNQQRVAIGNPAPDFSLKSNDGQDVSLEMYKGKYLLVDFWASWCGPCRAEIPNLKKVFANYHSKGLDILSVSTDAREKAWLKAVDAEQMPWEQVRDTKSISDVYNITAIPMIILIDPEGKIMDKGLRGEGLQKKLDEILMHK